MATTTTLFDAGEMNIVIVPPKPDVRLRGRSISHLDLLVEGSGGASDCAPDGDLSSSSDPSLSESLNSLGLDWCHVVDHSAVEEGRDGSETPRGGNGGEGTSTSVTRNASSGAFTFRVNSEYDLLMQVQKDLGRHHQRESACGDRAEDEFADDEFADIERSEVILRSIDGHCLRKQWMYHVGREKGTAIARFLRGGAESFVERHAGHVKRFTCVDLGTYCGYSALVLASTLRRFVRELRTEPRTSIPFEFHVYTTEVSSKVMDVARSVFRLAGVDSFVTPMLVKSDGSQQLSRSLIDRGVSGIDFLLLDHAERRYLPDLRELEDAGLLTAGSRICADNVAYHRLDAYRDHICSLVRRGAAASRLKETNLEYSDNLKDGLEMTVYLTDPPVHVYLRE